jgi:hypothetical protein
VSIQVPGCGVLSNGVQGVERCSSFQPSLQHLRTFLAHLSSFSWHLKVLAGSVEFGGGLEGQDLPRCFTFARRQERARSEREAQGVGFYLGKVLVAPTTAEETHRLGELGTRNAWNVKKGEWYLKVRWYSKVRPGIFQEQNHDFEKLLEMVV